MVCLKTTLFLLKDREIAAINCAQSIDIIPFYFCCPDEEPVMRIIAAAPFGFTSCRPA